MEERRPYWQVAVRLLFSLLATAAFEIIGIRLIGFLMPFVIGWLIAAVAAPLVNWLEKRLRIVKKLGSALIVVLVLAAIVLALYFGISRLVQEFDGRIVLSADGLHEIFGMENGKALLDPWFEGVTWHLYQDHLLITSPDPLIQYIQSCHGNQNQYILDKYKEFRSFVSKKTAEGFYITKDAGFFSCRN